MPAGCYTALITPFREGRVDARGLEALVDFQVDSGIDGVLAVGTTGESPVLSWEEHNQVVETVVHRTRGRSICIAGTGSNSTKEALSASEHAVKAGAEALLLVDPYYNGPSSLEIRREYVAPIARAFPQVSVIPYVIPGRTGAQLLPEDLGLLSQQFANVQTVKEATADLANMKRTRACCGPEFTILSGDDGMTFAMMTDPEINAGGVISVVSNVAPGAVVRMVRLLKEGKRTEAETLRDALAPLFGLVTIKTVENSPFGDVTCRARNPLGIKTMMTILGMPSGGCRPPLGRMTHSGLETVLEAARSVQSRNPEIFQPIEEHFGVDIKRRLEDPGSWESLYYPEY